LLQRQEEYYDIPTSTLTPVQIRDKLASLYAEISTLNQQIDAFRELLKLKSTPNGGVSVTDDLKYTSKSVSAGYQAVLMDRMQSNFPDRTGFMSPLRYCGTEYLPTRSPARGGKPSGRNSWRRGFQFKRFESKEALCKIGKTLIVRCDRAENNKCCDPSLTAEKVISGAFFERAGDPPFLY
jgi:hypothetical protein